VKDFKAIQTATQSAFSDGGNVWCNKRLVCQHRKICNAAKSHQHSPGECNTCDFNVDAKCVSVRG